MIKYLKLAIFASVSFIVVAATISFSVSGKIDGIGNDSLFLIVQRPNGYDTFRTLAHDDVFRFEGKVQQPGTAMIKAASHPKMVITLFVEAGYIKLAGSIDALESVSVTGTISNDDMTVFKKNEAVVYGELAQLYKNNQETTASASEKKKNVRKMNALEEEMDAARKDLIRRHPNSFTSALYLSILLDKLPLDTAQYYYHHLTSQMQESDFGRKIRQRLEGRAITKIGMHAPLFELKDPDGKTVRLADLKGKYVLIDFWASWCAPCRAEYPYLKKAYKEFNGKGFEILGISLDDNREKWIKAIHEEQLKWPNISDLKAQDGEVVRLYGVQPIPDNFLVDPDGIIIGRGLRGTALDETLKRLFQ